MPVNTAALKTFAPAMRRQLIEAVGRKLDLLLHQASADTLTTAAGPIAELRQQETTNRQELLERVAYSWFNRLAALRYLDARLWHPFGARVLMPQTETETQPELLKLLRSGSLPAELQPHTDEARLQGLLDGRLPTAQAGADPQGEVYRELILAVCRSYHQLLPNLFEGLDDASELLLPDDLLSDGSIAGGFRSQISDSDCEDVEILGWLYQFYIAEKKDEVMARKKAVPTEDIPAVTQLFTPHWIVRYLVENSLGRLWLLNRPESKLREQMPYYIEGEPETDFLRITKPEDIKLLDPACGSGHMLTYAFDLLSHIYTEEGYAATEIPGLILQHNLYGLDICPRAAQLAGLALALKAREQSRRFFQPGQLVQPQIIELQDVRFEEGELNDFIEALDLGELFDPNLFKLLHQFEEAKNFGSLIQPCLNERAIAELRRDIEAIDLRNQLFLRETHLKVLRVLAQAEMLTQRYQVVVANPPYMGGKGMNSGLRRFAQELFPDSKYDLFAMFLERGLRFILANGFMGMINLPSWLFLSSYETLRERLVSDYTIESLLHMGRGIFGIDWGSVAFVIKNHQQVDRRGHFFRLHKRNFQHLYQDDIGRLFSNANADHSYKYNFDDYRDDMEANEIPTNSNPSGQQIHYRCSPNEFKKIPGTPIVYWISRAFIDTFRFPCLGKIIQTEGQNKTADNDTFLRFHWEVSLCAIGRNQRWIPYAKGGSFRKWYGNVLNVVDWSDDAVGHYRKSYSCRIVGEEFLFRQGVTWTDITSSGTSFRYLPGTGTFDMSGPTAFFKNESEIWSSLALLNSKYTAQLLPVLNPTLHAQLRDIKAVPAQHLRIKYDHIHQLVSYSKLDWNSSEISPDFQSLPLLSASSDHAPTLESSYTAWISNNKQTIAEMKRLEEENNRLFIDAYGLQDELSPEVLIEQITLTVNPAYRYGGNLSEDELWIRFRQDTIKELLSYATGCMMGRYSLDHPGLILANAGDTLENYVAKVGKSTGDLSFQPDRDGIIPVLDGEWFEDDIVARSREFLRVCFPASSLNTDLAFIETALGKDLRKYFCTDFYKEHLQTYKKRPIYWLVQSPAGPSRGGFACLVYLHRYTKDTLNLVLNNYFRPFLQKLEARQAQLGLDQLNDALPSRDRTAARKEAEKISKVLKECEAWEQDSLLPLAQQRIELDLDDGVKVNYLKLQEVLAPIPGLAAKEE